MILLKIKDNPRLLLVEWLNETTGYDIRPNGSRLRVNGSTRSKDLSDNDYEILI